jgi:hypothetical protein
MVNSADQTWNPPNMRNGVNIANANNELVIAKNIPPSGEAKKSTKNIPLTNIGESWKLSNGPLGSLDGGSW